MVTTRRFLHLNDTGCASGLPVCETPRACPVKGASSSMLVSNNKKLGDVTNFDPVYQGKFQWNLLVDFSVGLWWDIIFPLIMGTHRKTKICAWGCWSGLYLYPTKARSLGSLLRLAGSYHRIAYKHRNAGYIMKQICAHSPECNMATDHCGVLGCWCFWKKGRTRRSRTSFGCTTKNTCALKRFRANATPTENTQSCTTGRATVSSNVYT